MKKLLVFVLCTFCLVVFSPAKAEDVVKLEPLVGAASEYSVAELLRVELMGDSIRFIADDGSVVAEVYKYDYVKLTIADQPEGIDSVTGNPSPVTAQKVLINGQVYILFGDKAYLITGTEVR
jgi:hypothetical protein